MLVRFKSAFYDGTTFWPIGVREVPATINGRKVVFQEKGKEVAADEFALPRSAEPADAVEPLPPSGDTPMALSEISAAKPTSFVEAMKTKK